VEETILGGELQSRGTCKVKHRQHASHACVAVAYPVLCRSPVQCKRYPELQTGTASPPSNANLFLPIRLSPRKGGEATPPARAMQLPHSKGRICSTERREKYFTFILMCREYLREVSRQTSN